MDKKQDLKVQLSKEQKDQLIQKIKKYFLTEREEELGDLGASLLLDFITKEIATEFYNQGIYDSYTYLNDRVEEMLGLQK